MSILLNLRLRSQLLWVIGTITIGFSAFFVASLLTFEHQRVGDRSTIASCAGRI